MHENNANSETISRQLNSLNLAKFSDPKTTKLRSSNNAYLSSLPEDQQSFLPPYSLVNILPAIQHFSRELLLVMYTSETDEFIVLLPYDQQSAEVPSCTLGCSRIENIMTAVLYAFRTKFSDRFQPQQTQQPVQIPEGEENKKNNDLLFLVSTADSPHVARWCVSDPDHCGSINFAPILSFGSGFQDESILPSLITMPPPPMMHLRCMNEWQLHGEVCEFLLPKNTEHSRGLVFGETIGLNYDDLIPQLIWRGTDFPFLNLLHQELKPPQYELDVLPKLESYGQTTEGVIHALKDIEGILRPRWKAVLITAEAELEASKLGSSIGLPWANMKFSAFPSHHEKDEDMAHNGFYEHWVELGIPAIGDEMSLADLAKYKYHIDIGGGGGTTWTGTIQKLAMPGLLFHHETPAKDYFYEHIKPWVHYVPVKEDLSDLKEKVQWAELNPRKARQISKAGARFAKEWGSPEGLDAMYQRHLLRPLAMVMDAYQQPVGAPVLSLLELEGYNGVGFKQVMRCTGNNVDDCKLLP